LPKKIAQHDPAPLERLFGSSTARLIDFFTLYGQWDYSKTDIAENAEVSVRTVARAIPFLEEHGMIKRTRMVGNAEMYQTNKQSPIMQYLSKASLAIADVDVRQELKRQGCLKEAQTKQHEIKQVAK